MVNCSFLYHLQNHKRYLASMRFTTVNMEGKEAKIIINSSRMLIVIARFFTMMVILTLQRTH